MAGPVTLFDRAYVLTVDTIQIKDLEVSFKIDKSLKPEPNKAEIKVKNLNAASRKALEQLGHAGVQLEAGYKGGSSVIFLGDLRVATTTREGTDLVTTVASGDGERAHQSARVNVSVQKNTPTDQVIRMVATALGVGTGNLDKAVGQINGAGLGSLFSAGTVITGQASREMTALCRSVGLTWSIQGGKLQILPLKKALEGEAIKLSPDTGLVGSPTVDGKTKILKARMLLAPDVFPGRLLVLDSEFIRGQYRIEATTYQGDFYANDWYIDLEGKRY